MEIIIQNYNDNLHEHEKPNKILSLLLQHYMKPGKIDVDEKMHQTSKMN